MLIQIIQHTPLWVWALLAALLALGVSQCFTRTASLPRSVITPVAMVGLSIYGTASAFGANGVVLLAWTAAALLAAFVVLRMPLPQGTRYHAASRSFTVPGSWVPLALIMGIFLTKYYVGVSLGMHPQLKADPTFTLGFGALYGAFSGMFAARAARLWRLAFGAARQALPGQASA